MFEDTKVEIRIRKSKKNRQHNGQKKKNKQRSTRHTHKTKDRVTQTPLKTRGELGCSGRVSSDICRVNLVANAELSHEYGSVYDKWNISVVICDTDIP